MEDNSNPGGHRLGPYYDHMPNCLPKYLASAQIETFTIPPEQDSHPTPEEFPHPVVQVTDALELHLFPADDHIRPMVVRRTDGEVLTDHHAPYGFWLTLDGMRDTVDGIVDGVESRTADSIPAGFHKELTTALTTDELLQEVFSEKLTEKLRPPTVRWLRERTHSVTADRVEYTGGEYVKTEWSIELAHGSDDVEFDPLVLEYHTDDLIQQDPQRFKADHHRLFHRRPWLSSTWWVDLSSYWLRTASVVDIVDEDYPSATPEQLSFRQSGRAKYHLVRDSTGETVCGYEARSGDSRPFSPDNLPIPPALCTHCSRVVKRHLLPSN